MEETISYGWTGKMLRINLTTGSITTEPTDPYKSYIGGMGIANKIMYDEVPAKTDPFSPENKVVFAVGPLTASGVPMCGRMTICSLSTFTKDHLVVDAHCGGMIGAKVKLAGYDAIIVEGKSPNPCYIDIVDDQVEIKDASDVWGLGTRATTEVLASIEGTDACVACIGPAGENLLPYACIINERNHSAGAGIGSVLGSKMCKGIVAKGNGRVCVADPQAVADLSDYMLTELIGANNNHAVPSTQQEWAEYYDESSRWTARKGLYWGNAEGEPIETGEPKPGEVNKIGYRTIKATKDLGDIAEKYTIKMDGCFGCPIHCYSDLQVEEAGKVTGMYTIGNTCELNSSYRTIQGFIGTTYDGDDLLKWNAVVGTTMDDLGLWDNYGQLQRDLGYCISSGILEKNLPADEYRSFDWNKFNENDPTIIVDILNRIARNASEISYLGHGPLVWTERWGSQKWFSNSKSQLASPRGWAKHHFIDDSFQVGAVTNMLFNRDPMVHTSTNFTRNGLPLELRQEIGAEIWGEGSIDGTKDFKPMNEAKANHTWWSVVCDILHDSLVICNWVWPMTVSPRKDRDYRGDLDLEAKFYTAVTGIETTKDDLYKASARIMTLQRANDVRGMGTNDLRMEHDRICEWVFTKDAAIEPFTPGTDKMEKNDFETALTMVYEQFHWDSDKGYPDAGCLDYYDMPDVKAELDSLGLL